MNLFKRKKAKHQYSVQDHFNQVVNELNPPRTKNYMEIREEEKRLEKEKEESDTQWKAFVEDERESNSKHNDEFLGGDIRYGKEVTPFISIHTQYAPPKTHIVKSEDYLYGASVRDMGSCDLGDIPKGDTRYNTPKEKHKASTEDILRTIETTEIYRKAKERILKAQQGQVGYGLDKYPEPLNASTWTIFETLDHAMDESVDRMHYFEMLRIKFEELMDESERVQLENDALVFTNHNLKRANEELRAFKKMTEEREAGFFNNEPIAFTQDLSGADQDGDFTYSGYGSISENISDTDKQLKKLSKQIKKTRSYLKLNSLEETLNEKL